MNDKELADRIVALGVGDWMENKDGRWYRIRDWGDYSQPELFTSDWRVAGAMMEKVINKDNREDNGNYDIQTHHESGKYWTMIDSNHGWANEGVQNESLPRAINEACVEALE